MPGRPSDLDYVAMPYTRDPEWPTQQPILQNQVKTLQTISGLEVRYRREKNEHSFEFLHEGRTVKKVFTYKKAKLYAQGVKLGKELVVRVVAKL